MVKFVIVTFQKEINNYFGGGGEESYRITISKIQVHHLITYRNDKHKYINSPHQVLLHIEAHRILWASDL